MPAPFSTMAKGFEPSDSGKVTAELRAHWTGATEIARLEQETGADAALSSVNDMPFRTMRLVSEHLQAGVGQLVQVKAFGDLPGSVGERLNDSLMRMQAFALSIGIPVERAQSMCALLPVGYFLPREGRLWTGELRQSRDNPYVRAELYDHTHVQYEAVETAQAMWCARGGVVLPTCPSLAMLPDYLNRQEARLVSIGANPQKLVLPSKDALAPQLEEVLPGLQALVAPPPALVFFSRLPGVGIELAKRACDFYLKNEMTALDALVQMSSPAGEWFPGWGKGNAAKLAQALAMTPRKVQAVDNKE